MSAQYLASEILSEIFTLLPENTIYQCMLVCKSWNTSATIQYFSTLKLGGKKNYSLELLAANLKNGYLGFFKYGYLVKKLIVKGSFEEFREPLVFFSLMMCLPYLKKIDISGCYIGSSILENLQMFSNDLDVKCIQDIEAFSPTRVLKSDPYEFLLYFNTCYTFRETMTCLRLYNVENSFVFDDGERKYCLDLLTDFKQLTRLYIEEYPSPVEKEKCAEYQLPFILKSCPKLIDLKIHRPIIKSSTSLLEKNSGSVFDGINLKKLDLALSTLEPSLMKYILTSINTSKLISFDLHKSLDETFDKITNNELLFLEFIRHASLSQSFNIHIENKAPVSPNIRHARNDMSKLYLIFWKIVQELYHTRKIKSIDMNINLLRGINQTGIHPTQPPEVSCGLHVINNELIFHQRIPFKDFFNAEEHGEIMSHLFDRYIADKTTSIEFFTEYGRFIEVLFFAMTKLPNIEKIVLKDSEKSPSQIIECHVNDQSLMDKDSNTHKLFSSLHIEGLVIKELTFSVMRSIVRNVGTLWLRDCHLPKLKDHNLSKKVYVLNLTKLKCLQTVCLSFDFIMDRFNKMTYLFKKVNTKGSIISKSYYMSEKRNGKHEFHLQKYMTNKGLPLKYEGAVIVVSFCSELSNIYL